MTPNRIFLATLIAIVSVSGSVSKGEVITYDFGGAVTNVDGDPFSLGIATSQSVSGSFSIDDTQSGFDNEFSSFTITVNGTNTITSDADNATTVSNALNDFADFGGADIFTIGKQTGTGTTEVDYSVNGGAFQTFDTGDTGGFSFIFLADTDGTAFSSDSYTELAGTTISDFEIAQGSVLTDQAVSFDYSITSFSQRGAGGGGGGGGAAVPEPSSFFLLGLGAIGLTCYRRRPRTFRGTSAGDAHQ